MPTKPRLKTVKRLFAVSGNLCAFPDCTKTIIDKKTGKVLGKICHIEAQSKEGPRYNEKQTSEERHGFSNLVLMCESHHDAIDLDKILYDVPRLLQIKALHEAKYKDGAEASDQIAQELIDFSYSTVQTTVIENLGQSGGQSAQYIINAGVGYRDVREIALDIFKENFLRLQKEAADVAMTRAEQMIDKFFVKMKEQQLNLESRVNDPGVLFTIYSAQREYAKTGDEHMADLLADFLVDRAKEANRNLRQIVSQEAISVIPTLTRQQLNTLTLIFWLVDARKLVTDLKSFKSIFLDKFVIPFISDFESKNSYYLHLISCRCCVLLPMKRSLVDILKSGYPGLLSNGFTPEEFKTIVGKDASEFQWIICKCLHDESRLQINVLDIQTLEISAATNKPTPEDLVKLKSLLTTRTLDNVSIEKFLIDHSPKLKTLLGVLC